MIDKMIFLEFIVSFYDIEKETEKHSTNVT
jgi:hypothetical protein